MNRPARVGRTVQARDLGSVVGTVTAAAVVITGRIVGAVSATAVIVATAAGVIGAATAGIGLDPGRDQTVTRRNACTSTGVPRDRSESPEMCS